MPGGRSGVLFLLLRAVLVVKWTLVFELVKESIQSPELKLQEKVSGRGEAQAQETGYRSKRRDCELGKEGAGEKEGREREREPETHWFPLS